MKVKPMSLSTELARRIMKLNPSSFDPEAVKWARNAIADMIGCTLLGAPTTTTDIAMLPEFMADGPCLVLGRKERLGLLEAAFVNGTAGHALDYDDTSKSLSGHPTVMIIPGLLAIAEAKGISGKDFVDAYIIGVEAVTRFARGVNFYHYEKGWHPTATLGIFGAAVACAVALKLDEKGIANAISISASLAAGVKANFGTDTKPLHAGIGARHGLFAALLAEQGVNGSLDALEHPQGFLEVFNGAGNYDVDRMLVNWASPLDLLDPGISIKKYPCVYSVHGAIDAAIKLHGDLLSDSSKISDVLVRMHPRRLLPHVRNAATSALNAKFSLPYAVARGIVNGSVLLEHFEERALHDPEVSRVMGLVRMEPHDDDSNDYGAEVIIRLSDGSTLQQVVSSPLGRGPEAPLPQEMLAAKFLDCAKHSLTDQGAIDVFDLLMRMDQVSQVSELTDAIQAATLTAPKGLSL